MVVGAPSPPQEGGLSRSGMVLRRNGARVCPTGGHGLPDKRARPAVWGDECNEIGLKFLPDYNLSATFEYPVQKFSPMGGTASPTGGFPPVPPLAPPLVLRWLSFAMKCLELMWISEGMRKILAAAYKDRQQSNKQETSRLYSRGEGFESLLLYLFNRK
ncbi:hypothetical protein AVEN_80681-1 [Araneus ventricosus]|uniref:Uncharacterized protein n=1 Tax=Araneus ventricosus TaxID=182803 RepID=A0A4Y2PMW3_ARAVE|nr:hypothetical protein AVEN_80681-1 [Araneus ventricosus]